MKKLLLSALLIGGAAASAIAQAGSVLVFGNFGIKTEKAANDDKSFNFNLNPGVGYQIDNHWTLGVEGRIGTLRTKPDNSNIWLFSDQYKAGAFVRFTQPLGRQNIFSFFTQAGVGYEGSASGTTASSNVSSTSNGAYGYVMPSLAINVYKGLALNFAIGGIDFGTQRAKGATTSYTSFGVTFGQQFNIGISKNFSCGKRKHSVGTNHGSRSKHQEDETDESED